MGPASRSLAGMSDEELPHHLVGRDGHGGRTDDGLDPGGEGAAGPGVASVGDPVELYRRARALVLDERDVVRDDRLGRVGIAIVAFGPRRGDLGHRRSLGLGAVGRADVTQGLTRAVGRGEVERGFAEATGVGHEIVAGAVERDDRNGFGGIAAVDRADTGHGCDCRDPVGVLARDRRSHERAVREAGHVEAVLVDAQGLTDLVEQIAGEDEVRAAELGVPAGDVALALRRDRHEALLVAVGPELTVGGMDPCALAVAVEVEHHRQRIGPVIGRRDLTEVPALVAARRRLRGHLGSDRIPLDHRGFAGVTTGRGVAARGTRRGDHGDAHEDGNEDTDPGHLPILALRGRLAPAAGLTCARTSGRTGPRLPDRRGCVRDGRSVGSCCPTRHRQHRHRERNVMDRAKLDGLFDLRGRVAIVTGGTRGIGRAIAEGFVAAGASVVVASRKADACARTEADLVALGGQALGVPTHLGDLDGVDALVARTVDRFGRVDIVVNNAATALAQPLGAFTPDAWAKVFDVDLRGPVFLVQAALPHLEASPHAAVVNVISAGAFLFSPEVVMYAAAKAALMSFTRSMAAAFAPRGIRVNALAPGTVDTDMVRGTGPEAAAHMAAASFMRRAADPDEMVGPALFLASDASSYVTGQVVLADGGLVPH